MIPIPGRNAGGIPNDCSCYRLDSKVSVPANTVGAARSVPKVLILLL